MIYNNILGLIGRTPLVKINKLSPNHQVILLAKLEFFNPGGSIKDRIGLAMLESAEKKKILLKNGIVIAPTAVPPENKKSYYKVTEKLVREIPNAFQPDQYNNPDNPKAHFMTTGPEIWKDTKGKVTHVVVGMGTGGTITGIGKFLKKKNSNIKIIGVDPIGSIFYQYFKTGKYPKA